MQYLVATTTTKKPRMISVHFQGKPFTITVIQIYVPTSDAEEVEWFYEELQDLLELTPQKDVFFIVGGWSYMILYMFQCHSPKSSHPLPLQQSP